MKKLLLSVFLFLGLLSITHAQKILEGSFEFTANLKEVNIVIDYKDVIVDGKNEESFVVQKTFEEDEGEEWRNYWNNKVKKLFMYKFCSAISENEDIKSLGVLIGDYPNALYTATFVLNRVDGDGELYGNVVFTENSSKKILAIVKLNGDGGHWGSIENLMGDAFEKAGKRFGQFLSDRIYYNSPDNKPKYNY